MFFRKFTSLVFLYKIPPFTRRFLGFHLCKMLLEIQIRFSSRGIEKEVLFISQQVSIIRQNKMTSFYHWNVQQESWGFIFLEKEVVRYLPFDVHWLISASLSPCKFPWSVPLGSFFHPSVLGYLIAHASLWLPQCRRCVLFSLWFSPIISVGIESRELAIIGSPAFYSFNRYHSNSYILAPLGGRCIFRNNWWRLNPLADFPKT